MKKHILLIVCILITLSFAIQLQNKQIKMDLNGSEIKSHTKRVGSKLIIGFTQMELIAGHSQNVLVKAKEK